MASESESSPERHDLSPQILSASVVMVGVSTTLIGLVKVAKGHMGPSRVDEYAGLAALLFLSARADPTYPFAMAILPTSAGEVSGLRPNLHLRARCHLGYCWVVCLRAHQTGQ